MAILIIISQVLRLKEQVGRGSWLGHNEFQRRHLFFCLRPGGDQLLCWQNLQKPKKQFYYDDGDDDDDDDDDNCDHFYKKT